MSAELRSALRRQLRSKRRSLSPLMQRQASRALVNHCRHWQTFQAAGSLAFYLPVGGEIDPRPLMQHAHRLGKHCFLPLIRPFPAHTLTFVRWRPGQRLYSRRWHIREPRQGLRVTAGRLDMIFMPLTAFDLEGGRLGMGGGFYDRTLAAKAACPRPLRVGLAHDCQQVEQVPSETWDIRLHAVLTPSGLRRIARRIGGGLQRKNSG